MPRLRTLLVTETDAAGRARSRDILILDRLTAEELSDATIPPRVDGIPPIMMFDADLELPQSEEDVDVADLPEHTQAALVALGWTPPADGQE